MRDRENFAPYYRLNDMSTRNNEDFPISFRLRANVCLKGYGVHRTINKLVVMCKALSTPTRNENFFELREGWVRKELLCDGFCDTRISCNTKLFSTHHLFVNGLDLPQETFD